MIGASEVAKAARSMIARYRRKVVVFDTGDSRAAQIPESHNHPGFTGIAGPGGHWVTSLPLAIYSSIRELRSFVDPT